MAKVPGVTKDLLQKQILELLEGIGIPAKEWIGKGGSTVRRLVTKTELSPFKPDMLSAMSQGKKTFGDALDAFSNEAKFIMNANDQELMNFKNNINDFTSLGGSPRGSGGEGIGSMMKSLDDEMENLKKLTEDLKKTTEKQPSIQDLMMGMMKSQADMMPGGESYKTGNVRTAVREFLKSEVKKGNLVLDEKDTFRITEYSPLTEDDPIDVFRRWYGENALEAVDNISSVFEKGESFKHYEQLLRENVDEKFLTQKTTGAGELDPSVKAGEDIRTKVEEGEIDPLKPNDDDLPFNQGGRVGLKLGGDAARKAIIKKLKDWVNTSLKENKGVASMFKKKLNDSADLDDLQFETVLDDFVTTADEMSGAKINSNRSVQNKRDLLRAIEKWNENPKHTFFRGIDKKYTDVITKDMSDIEKIKYQEAIDQGFAQNVDRGWNNFLRPGDTKKDVFTPENYGSFFSSDPYTARSYAHAKVGSLPEIRKVKLTTEEVQKGLERNFENNPFAYSDDIMLEKELADKAKRDWLESIKAKWEFPDNWSTGGRVGLKYGTKKLFSFTKKQLKEAVENIFQTGDRKYDAEMVAESLVENNPKMFRNRLRDDLLDSEYSEVYGEALDALATFNAEAKALMKPKSKGQIWKDEKGETAGIAMGFSESEMGGLDKAMQKGMALSNAMKAMGMDPASSNQTIKFDQLVSEGMIGFPKDIKEQIIRAKYGAVVDERLINNLLIDDNPQRLAQVMGTIDEGLIMQEKGMAPDEIIESIKSSLDRKPNAAGGGIGSMFKATDRVGLVKGSVKQYAYHAGKTMKEILDGLMKHKKIRNLVEQVNKKLHETGIAKMWYQDRTLNDKDKIIASKVIAPFVETVDKLLPWKTTDKSARNATINWFRESINNPKFKEVYHPDWEKGKTVFRGMKHPEDLQYSKDNPSNMFMTKEHTKMFKPENVGAFATESPEHAIRFAAEAKGFPHVKKTHLSPLEFQESVERNLLENPYGVTSDVILDAEKKAALETDIMATGIAAFKKYWPFNEGGTVDKQNLNKDGVGSMFKGV